MREDNDKNKNKIKQKKKLIFALLSLVVILIAANGWLSYFYVKNRDVDFAVSENNKYNLLNPARKFVKQEDLIINLQPLRDYLNDTYGENEKVSIYFEYLPTGSNISINKDTEFYPASLLKVPITMAVAKKIEKGEWKWTNELVLMPSDKNKGFGSLYKEPSNSTYTIDELVRRSLSDSDNTANFILVRNLEISEIEDVNSHIGFSGIITASGNLSAKRYSIIFRALYNSSYLSEESSQKLLSYLSQSPFKEYIESALPSDIPFAHKIGTEKEKGIYLDSGIVYAPNRPYILTIMIKSKNEQLAQEKMKDISEKVYNYIKEYKE